MSSSTLSTSETGRARRRSGAAAGGANKEKFPEAEAKYTSEGMRRRSQRIPPHEMEKMKTAYGIPSLSEMDVFRKYDHASVAMFR